MLKLPKRAVIAIQATLGIALSAPWAVPALAAPANTTTQWVICTWWSQGWGGFQSTGFPIAMVAGPVTLPPDDAHPQTTGQKSPTEPSVPRSGDSSSTGQTN